MSDNTFKYSVETLTAQGLGRIDPASGGIVPPIQPSTTFERDADLSFDTYGRIYGRPSNPTVEPAEEMINALEGGADTLLFASGMAASAGLMLALKPGDHVIASRATYWAMRWWLSAHGATWGLDVDFLSGLSLEEIASAIRPGKTRLVWLETLTNPTWIVTDIARAADLAHQAGALLAIDNTAATPVHTKPLSLGADIVMNSATKYLNGHSDVIGGSLTCKNKDELWEKIIFVRRQYGGVMGAFEAWLLHRGLRTLYVRMRTHSDNAMAIARHFENHPKIEKVFYPGLPSFDGHEIAKRQMVEGFGGMMSILVKGGKEKAVTAVAKTQLFKRATSFGGTESLIEHRASIEGEGTLCPDHLLRLSIGLEKAEDLIADLEQALNG